MKLNTKLPNWVFVLTIIIATIVIFLITQEAVAGLKEIRQISVETAELTKDFCKFNKEKTTKAVFCGWSTEGDCFSDKDCMGGGCSGQVCQSINEESVLTTCEYRDCYNSRAYALECRCVNNKCKWD